MRVAAKLSQFISKYRRQLLISAVVFGLAIVLTLINYLVIGSYGRYILSNSELAGKDTMVAVVLGGGIENGKPRPLLQDRLDTAAALLKAGKVRKLVVSGDNRTAGYNEPEVMRNYLIKEKGVKPAAIQLDNAGRSTYETCERSVKVFGLTEAVFISESTHLPRVLYTCRSFGIEAYGYSSDGQSSAGLKVGQRFREILARTKASLNIYIIGERTVLGEKTRV